MIILIFLNCIHLTLNQKIEQTYQNVQGVQSFKLKNLTKDGFPYRSKITISLTYFEREIPILLLCTGKPYANMSMDYDSITKEQCQFDANAYEDKIKKQVVSLQDKLIMKKYHKNFNIYEFQENGLFIGAISTFQSSYKIHAEIISIYVCSKECSNGGSCFQGVCECLKGTFGDDCSIQGLDILQQSTLSSNYLYYLDIAQLTGATFLRILSNSISLRQQCYADNPQVNHGNQVLTNLIQIDHDRIENCKNVTLQVQDQLKVQQIPYYLFKISNTSNVEIIDNNVQQVGISKVLLILFIPLSIILFLFMICCCYRLLKKRANQQQQQKLQTEPIPTYVDIYILLIYKKMQFLNYYHIKYKQFSVQKIILNILSKMFLYQKNIIIKITIPTQKFQEIKESDGHSITVDYQYCSICLERFHQLNNVKITYCKHLYHSKCLTLWIEKIKVCPLCRAPLDEQTIMSMQHPKSMTLIDQITNKSSNKLKPSNGSLSFFNNQNLNRFQNINYQRSLVCIDQ